MSAPSQTASTAKTPIDGNLIYQWASDLFPICRSLTGDGVRETLGYFQQRLPGFKLHSVASGSEVFDWTVPEEWNIRDAFIATENGERIVDFNTTNLHVVGYSEPVDTRMTFRELDAHLYHLKDQPDVVPYITSYYKRRWGFCLSYNQYLELQKYPDREYHVRIDSDFRIGELNYGELILPGTSQEEVFFSTYVCHPSMANNELSGPCVQATLASWIQQSLPNHRLTYRFYFGPETIGAIAYLSERLAELKRNVIAGYVLSCVGDNRTYSYLASREGDTLADHIAKHVLQHTTDEYKTYSFLDRGSDERQYCSPGVDLPVCTLSRSKYMEYPEYHTSLDDLSLISPEGLGGSLTLLQEIVTALEANQQLRTICPCEPQLGKRGLYPSLSTKETRDQVATMMNLLAYADGKRDLVSLADRIGVYVGQLVPLVEQMIEGGVMVVD